MQLVPSTITSRSFHQLRVSADPAATTRIEQRFAAVTPEPYLVVGGGFESMPLLAACSTTLASTTGSPL